jgi:hypothetical protein
MLLSRRNLLGFSLKILLAWLTMTGLIMFAGEWLLTPCFPLLETVIIKVASEFSPALELIPSVDGGRLELNVWVLSPVYIDAEVVIPKGLELTSSTHLLHIFVPIAILLSILLVWPVQSQPQKLLLIAFGLLVSVLILLATVPVLLVALLEMPFQEMAMQANSLYKPPWFMDWMIFCEMGGTLLLALTGAFLCIWLQQRCLTVRR